MTVDQSEERGLRIIRLRAENVKRLTRRSRDVSDRQMQADRIELPPWTERPGVPFSLECTGCDAGMDVISMAQARLLGWQNVFYDDGPAWHYLGLCPFCAAQEAEDQGRAAEADRVRRNAERRAKRR